MENSISTHFTLHPLAEGIFAAVAVNGGYAICNAGLVDLGGQILVFDTFLTPQAAMDFRRFAIAHFGRSPQLVINSHYHNDHIWGNQVFTDDALILSSSRTRDLIATEGVEEYKWYSANSARRLEELRGQYMNATGEQQKQELLLWMGEYGGIVESLPTLKVRMPEITFKQWLEIHGAKRTAQMITFEGGHTGSDTVLYLPQDRIVFLSDLLFVGFHPYLLEGDPLILQKALRELCQLDATCFVPGHGPIGTVQDINLLIDYIEQGYATARELLDTGSANEDVIQRLTVPEAFQDWNLLQFYRTNISSICKRLGQTNIDK